MKINMMIAVVACGLVTACGPGANTKSSNQAEKPAVLTAPTGPEYDSTGVVAAVDGQTLTLDHEGASAAQLAPGRTVFKTYADVLAEAPIKPGDRVALKFMKVGQGYQLTELRAR
ncbi:MAG: copper-binding protein [Caulobacter sp.]|nr:copper-binding protein [Caulobacter sp.]